MGYVLKADVEEVDLLQFEEAIRAARGHATQKALHAADRQFGEALALWHGTPAEGTWLTGPLLRRVTELNERLYASLGDAVGEANTLNSLGWNHALLTDFAKARRYCEQALALQRGHGDRVGEAATLDSLGYIAHHTGQYTRAIDHYHHALTLRRESGNAGQEAETLSHLGDTYRAMGEYDEAARVWSRALAIYQDQHRSAKVKHVQARLDALGDGRREVSNGWVTGAAPGEHSRRAAEPRQGD
ncbi:hypothetical protein GCM10022419_136540 [Nonomuraea rosea]|uniref:Bacterial transcriptional activator domain-containing protein n=1 Tax=Nonomuraea rosea TaxID=638574 RepID=A0ABP7AAY2_9ACTN